MTEHLTDRIRDALRVVIDPELGFNIVDLGFVYDIAVTNSEACITMTATTRGCPAAVFLKDGVARAATVPGIRSVNVVMTFEPPWTPAMMTNEARTELGFANSN
ncbi:metal-sulfur cluster assembly factor [Bradyrhizobium sp. HKCCYLS1011]|uniref:metal-sulfur cluster assembly factor n=1 Tax=Bradyrhizobium sp. HKCCYLS1011 TaxID=3420733 RepID=UPI003EBCB8D8